MDAEPAVVDSRYLAEGFKSARPQQKGLLTFYIPRPIISIKDWARPADVEVGLDSHDC